MNEDIIGIIVAVLSCVVAAVAIGVMVSSYLSYRAAVRRALAEADYGIEVFRQMAADIAERERAKREGK